MKTKPPAAPKSTCCGAPLAWKQLCGMRVYRLRGGRRYYAVRCTDCGRTYEVKR